MKGRITLIDNLDSFSYNLVDELSQLGYELRVYRNTISPARLLSELDSYSGPQVVCLSPGPGSPSQAGELMAMIDACQRRYPMLGICLGFQALAEKSGARVARCGEVVHGKTAHMSIRAHPLFASQPHQHQCVIGRYHSLSIYDLPDSIQVVGECQSVNGLIPMAAEFTEFNAVGFQFHPESLLTPTGKLMLQDAVQYLFQQFNEGRSHE
tara:strand:- start:670 stop:1299 length:630 start_codon:yes stop_codon:yes gene_type:complete